MIKTPFPLLTGKLLWHCVQLAELGGAPHRSSGGHPEYANADAAIMSKPRQMAPILFMEFVLLVVMSSLSFDY
jgi:hypothetical protein